MEALSSCKASKSADRNPEEAERQTTRLRAPILFGCIGTKDARLCREVTTLFTYLRTRWPFPADKTAAFELVEGLKNQPTNKGKGTGQKDKPLIASGGQLVNICERVPMHAV